jgi:nucleotide-binding universal stress UspA family protein
MYDSILLPTDGSSNTTEALEHACAIARDNDATVHVLYVVDRRHLMAADEETTDEIRQSLEEESERALEDARLRLEEENIDMATVREEGIPHKTITGYAEEEDVDIVVMGTHGKTGRERVATLGSTTERVVKNAEQPVLVVEIGD